MSDQEPRKIDLTEATPSSDVQDETDRGSAWAEIDETFFRITADVFPRQLCFGMSVLLASNDSQEIELPRQRTAADDEAAAADQLSHQELLDRINAEIDRELEIRRAMRRHPSRRRF